MFDDRTTGWTGEKTSQLPSAYLKNVCGCDCKFCFRKSEKTRKVNENKPSKKFQQN